MHKETMEKGLSFLNEERNAYRPRKICELINKIRKHDYLVPADSLDQIKNLVVDIESNPYYSRELIGVDQILTHVIVTKVFMRDKIKWVVEYENMKDNPLWAYTVLFVIESLVFAKPWQADPEAIDIFIAMHKMSDEYLKKLISFFVLCIEKNNEIHKEKKELMEFCAFLIEHNETFQKFYADFLLFDELRARIASHKHQEVMCLLVEHIETPRVLVTWLHASRGFQQFENKQNIGLELGLWIQTILWMKPALDMSLKPNYHD